MMDAHNLWSKLMDFSIHGCQAMQIVGKLPHIQCRWKRIFSVVFIRFLLFRNSNANLGKNQINKFLWARNTFSFLSQKDSIVWIVLNSNIFTTLLLMLLRFKLKANISKAKIHEKWEKQQLADWSIFRFLHKFRQTWKPVHSFIQSVHIFLHQSWHW